MSIAAELGGDALSTFIGEVEESLAKLKMRISENPYPCGSRALAFAMQAGLPPRMTYNVTETAKYLGVDVKTLREENEAGRIAFIIPEGKERGARITVNEVDRWLSENEGRAA